MKYKVGDKVRVREDLEVGDGFGCTTAVEDMLKYRGKIVTIKEARSSVVGNYTIYEIDDDSEFWVWTDEMLEPAYADGGYVPYHKIPTPSKPVLIADQLDSLADAWSRLGCTSFQMATDVINRALKKSEEKNLKFTFYVKEGARVDKSCAGTIPTMTTNIELSDGNVFDEITTIKGSATCDKADYDERQGVLEALANAVCGGEFEKRYRKAVKVNKDADLWMRTCYYCGKVFDTVEEKVAHDDWHVERKKARHERYLLRKRAKEIAFEEQAQKMAKEMMGEQK